MARLDLVIGQKVRDEIQVRVEADPVRQRADFEMGEDEGDAPCLAVETRNGRGRLGQHDRAVTAGQEGQVCAPIVRHQARAAGAGNPPACLLVKDGQGRDGDARAGAAKQSSEHGARDLAGWNGQDMTPGCTRGKIVEHASGADSVAGGFRRAATNATVNVAGGGGCVRIGWIPDEGKTGRQGLANLSDHHERLIVGAGIPLLVEDDTIARHPAMGREG